MADELIRLERVSKRFRKGKHAVEVFAEIDLTISEGEFVAIMGPSGSGKTTLLNLIGGIDRASSGAIHFGGERIDQKSEGQLSRWRASSVGFVFQFYNLMPTLTAAANVELPLLLTRLGRAARKEHVRTALSLVNMEDRARHRPHELSGGQQQRIAIARAIVSDPRALLCDEPTGDLDRDTAGEILATIQHLSRKMGKTILMVTHDPEAARFASRILHLDKGRFTERESV